MWDDSVSSAITNMSEQVQTPIVAAHRVAWWVLEIELPPQCEAGFPADRVRWRVIDRWKSVQGAMLPVAARPLHDFRNGSRGDTLALKLWEHAKAGFLHILVLPFLLPVAD